MRGRAESGVGGGDEYPGVDGFEQVAPLGCVAGIASGFALFIEGSGAGYEAASSAGEPITAEVFAQEFVGRFRGVELGVGCGSPPSRSEGCTVDHQHRGNCQHRRTGSSWPLDSGGDGGNQGDRDKRRPEKRLPRRHHVERVGVVAQGPQQQDPQHRADRPDNDGTTATPTAATLDRVETTGRGNGDHEGKQPAKSSERIEVEHWQFRRKVDVWTVNENEGAKHDRRCDCCHLNPGLAGRSLADHRGGCQQKRADPHERRPFDGIAGAAVWAVGRAKRIRAHEGDGFDRITVDPGEVVAGKLCPVERDPKWNERHCREHEAEQRAGSSSAQRLEPGRSGAMIEQRAQQPVGRGQGNRHHCHRRESLEHHPADSQRNGRDRARSRPLDLAFHSPEEDRHHGAHVALRPKRPGHLEPAERVDGGPGHRCQTGESDQSEKRDRTEHGCDDSQQHHPHGRPANRKRRVGDLGRGEGVDVLPGATHDVWIPQPEITAANPFTPLVHTRQPGIDQVGHGSRRDGLAGGNRGSPRIEVQQVVGSSERTVADKGRPEHRENRGHQRDGHQVSGPNALTASVDGHLAARSCCVAGAVSADSDRSANREMPVTHPPHRTESQSPESGSANR